jgi:hypothetical protein
MDHTIGFESSDAEGSLRSRIRERADTAIRMSNPAMTGKRPAGLIAGGIGLQRYHAPPAKPKTRMRRAADAAMCMGYLQIPTMLKVEVYTRLKSRSKRVLSWV